MIKELCTYIANNTSFTLGIDLFALSVDSDLIDRCVVIAETGAGLVHGTLTDYRQVPVTAYTRAATRFTARDDAYTVFDCLHGKQQIELPVVGSGYTYTCNFECRTPYYIGLDESGRRHGYSMPIDVTVTNMAE